MKTYIALFAVLLVAVSSVNAVTSVIQDNDRIVFIGDSITGQGDNRGKEGWISMIAEGLALERPSAKLTLVGLGGSGAGVNAWLIYENKSRTAPLLLDSKVNDVGQTLDAGAQIVVVMLGMNDVLAPSLKGTQPAEFDAWEAKYSSLVDAIRARSHPRVFAVATVTPCTEDIAAPKNQAIAELNRRIQKLAKEKDLMVLPTGAAVWEMLKWGQSFRSDFHVTNDFVHPNAPGHVAIAAGMLRGFGEEQAASKLIEKYSTRFRPAASRATTLSYTLTRFPSSPDDENARFAIDFEWNSTTPEAVPQVKAILPEGWKANPATITAAKSRIECTGPLDRIENRISLVATAGSETREQTVSIPPGWRIAVGAGKGAGWTANKIYDPAKDRQPADETLASGDGFGTPAAFPVGDASAWNLFVASPYYTGWNKPGSVDMAAVGFFKHQDVAYGARWIYSEKERPVNLNLSTQTFATMHSLAVWLNGTLAYEGKLVDEPGRKVTAASRLQKGWNRVLFKSNFIQWQWQFSIDLAGQDGDDLADLRYAIKPSELK